MNMVFEKLGQPLAAGEKWPIGIAGTHFRLSECQWPVTVTLLRGNQVIGAMSNMLAGDYFEDIEYDAIWITNGAFAQTVRCQLSGGGAGSDRVLGEVSVINGELNRVKAGQCFIGLAASGNVAGQYSAGQLWNPVGSAKNLILNKASIMSGVANSPFWMTKHGAALAGLGATVTSKLLGGAAPVGEVRTAANAAMIGALVGNFGAAGAYDSRDFPFSEPVIIPPGYGVIFQLAMVNAAAWATFQWNEEPI